MVEVIYIVSANLGLNMWKVYQEECLRDSAHPVGFVGYCLEFVDGCIALERIGGESSGDLERELLIQCPDTGIQFSDCEPESSKLN